MTRPAGAPARQHGGIHSDEAETVLIAGVAGLITYLIVGGLSGYIGAMYVRSLTVYLVRQGTLDDYVYLEHGAHYAIGALAVILLVTIRYEIHEVITGSSASS